MASIVKAPDCCGRYLGQLFGRIAAGNAVGYYGYLCNECRGGVTGKEVEVDFSDGKPYRGMTGDMLRDFKTTHAPNWQAKAVAEAATVSITDPTTMLRGPMQAALEVVLKPCEAAA